MGEGPGEKRITEEELIVPALTVINAQPRINTTELISILRMVVHPTGEDPEGLQGRHDDKISQKVRNLFSTRS
jgi:hypothetical protein